MTTPLHRAAAVAAVLASASAAPAAAFDALERFMRVAPPIDLAKPGALLSHIDLRVFAAKTGVPPVVAVNPGGLPMAVAVAREPAGAPQFEELFGVKLEAMTFHTETGAPPENLHHVEFAPGSAPRIAAALERRGFARETLGRHTVFAKGDDNAVDIAGRQPADPFGGHLGLSQRVLPRDGASVVTRAWPTMHAAIAAIDGKRDPAVVALAATIPPLREAVGKGAVAEQAALYGLASFAGATANRAALDAVLAGKRPPTQPAGLTMPLFAAAWLASGRIDKDAFAAVATLHSDAIAAREGNAAIARRIAAFSTGEGAAPVVSTKVASAGAVWVSVVVLRFAGQPPERGARALRAWTQAITERAFTPLDPMK
ncbi:MAG: hypothetical protein IPK81_14335 [Rhodospirillales bacterium]|nr:MAG: hypothetical protein IPK81_14335 [Rhodospirillales bacterium]